MRSLIDKLAGNTDSFEPGAITDTVRTTCPPAASRIVSVESPTSKPVTVSVPAGDDPDIVARTLKGFVFVMVYAPAPPLTE